jgi:hypothetical protein
LSVYIYTHKKEKEKEKKIRKKNKKGASTFSFGFYFLLFNSLKTIRSNQTKKKKPASKRKHIPHGLPST